MTSIVALRCSDGVVVGSDSAVTLGGGGGQLNTIEQHTGQKVRLIGEDIILTGTGSLGLMQRFYAAVSRKHAAGKLNEVPSGIEFAKKLCDIGLRDFQSTHLTEINFSAYVAFMSNGEPHLCELDGGDHFQPEMKEPLDLWYVSGGVGQQITDPFLALLREVFWPDGPPNLRGGIFTALWALKHACEINAGGVGYPLHIATLDSRTGKARILSEEELAEHENMVQAASTHLGAFRDILKGNAETGVPDKVPSVA